jgi:hypothetical protein
MTQFDLFVATEAAPAKVTGWQRRPSQWWIELAEGAGNSAIFARKSIVGMKPIHRAYASLHLIASKPDLVSCNLRYRFPT